MNNICAIPKLKSHHFVPKGTYITVYNNTVKQFKSFFKAPRFRHALRQALTTTLPMNAAWARRRMSHDNAWQQAGLLKRSHHYPRVDSSETTRAWQCASSNKKIPRSCVSTTLQTRPLSSVDAVSQSARAHTRHTPDVCAHSDHLDMVVYKR